LPECGGFGVVRKGFISDVSYKCAHEDQSCCRCLSRFNRCRFQRVCGWIANIHGLTHPCFSRFEIAEGRGKALFHADQLQKDSEAAYGVMINRRVGELAGTLTKLCIAVMKIRDHCLLIHGSCFHCSHEFKRKVVEL